MRPLSTAPFHSTTMHYVVLATDFRHVRRVELPIQLSQGVKCCSQECLILRKVEVVHKGLGGKATYVLLSPVGDEIEVLPRRKMSRTATKYTSQRLTFAGSHALSERRLVFNASSNSLSLQLYPSVASRAVA